MSQYSDGVETKVQESEEFMGKDHLIPISESLEKFRNTIYQNRLTKPDL